VNRDQLAVRLESDRGRVFYINVSAEHGIEIRQRRADVLIEICYAMY
jgi:hypothetical protein